MENTEETKNQEKQNKESASETKSYILGEALMDIPFQLGMNVIHTSANKELADTANDGILDNIAQALTSVKDTIADNSTEWMESISETAGNVVGEIANAVGDAVSNIDL